MTAFFRMQDRALVAARNRRAVLCGLAIGLLVSVPAMAAAQAAKAPKTVASVGTDPASTSATYGDWVLHCQRLGEADKAQRICEISQTIQAQNQRDPIAEVAFGHLPNDPALRLTMALPPSISFPSTVTVATAAPAPATVELQWKRCLPGSCFADTVPPDDAIKIWRGMTGTGKITFKDAGSHDIALPLSFRGFAQALDALPK